MDLPTTIKTAVCTIISKNYLVYAKTLFHSVKSQNPSALFYLLLVDRNDGDIDLSQEPFEVIEVSSLGIADFERISFRYNITELNTSVKPTFLKFLLTERRISRLLYLDPDILVYQPLDEIFTLLDENEVLLTPHCTSPINDDMRPSERDFLVNGVFNLGFTGVKNSPESLRFLRWWEDRCLTNGFVETQTGLFVDQKWINFAPCFFNGVYLLKHPGCNMAYWNLRERVLEKKNGQWVVNRDWPLIFFHFSGIEPEDPHQISRHQNRYNLNSRQDLRGIFNEYREMLRANELGESRRFPYAYGAFSNGEAITQIARRLYAVHEETFQGKDPFSSEGDVYRWCKKNGFLGPTDQSDKYNSMNYRQNAPQLLVIHWGLRILLRLLKSDRYTMLMKYLSYITVLRNQKNLFRV